MHKKYTNTIYYNRDNKSQTSLFKNLGVQEIRQNLIRIGSRQSEPRKIKTVKIVVNGSVNRNVYK